LKLEWWGAPLVREEKYQRKGNLWQDSGGGGGDNDFNNRISRTLHEKFDRWRILI
jgi:hypothetical protein